MLKSIHLERFKKFQDVTIELNPFSVLMGENSSGKTSVLQAINLALFLLSSESFITKKDSGLKIRESGIGLNSLIGMNISDNKEIYFSKLNRGGAGGGSEGANIELIDNKSNKFIFRITTMFGNYNIKFLSTLIDLKNTPTLHLYRPLLISGFVGMSTSEERAFPRVLQDRMHSGRVSNIIRNLLLDAKKKKPDNFNKLRIRLQQDFDFNLDNDVDFDEQKDLFVKAHYSELINTKNISFDFNSSGSGFMQVLQILAPIYLYCPDESNIVLLDEPDAHLHPNLQTALAKSLREIQKELNIQIIISTHSTSIIRAADPSEVIPISSQNKLIRPLSSTTEVEMEILDRIDTYELAKSVLSGKIVFFEDDNLDIFEKIDKLVGTKCFSGVNTVPVIKGKGKDDKSAFLTFDIIKTMIKQEVEVHVIRDNDGLDESWKDKINNYAKAHHSFMHLLDRYEIENYILIPSLFHRVLIEMNPGKHIPTEKEIKVKICEKLRETIYHAKFRYQNNLEENILKTAYLINDEEFKKPDNYKREAIRIWDINDKKNTYEDLIIVGMGKEAMKGVFSWITTELKLRISRAKFIDSLTVEDVTEELILILKTLISKESKNTG